MREDSSAKLRQGIGGPKISFGNGPEGEVKVVLSVQTKIRCIDFHEVNNSTPFSLCVQDMDQLGVFFNNLEDKLVHGDGIIPTVRKLGHPFFQLSKEEDSITFLAHDNFLIERELRRLHRRFGHPVTEIL